MPDYQYLNNTPRMNAIQDMGQTFGGLATALPQLQMQAQLFRQRMALQRAQELLNDQRMNESKARAKLYEGEQSLRAAQTIEAGARTEHVQGQEERERNIAQAALMMGQALSNRYQQQQMGGQQGPPTGEQDATMQAIQAASLLSARDPALMGRFMNELDPQKMTTTRPGEVVIGPRGNPIYTNTQPYASELATRALAPGAELYQGTNAIATNENMRASSKTGGMSDIQKAAMNRLEEYRRTGKVSGGPLNVAAPPPTGPGTSFKAADGTIVKIGDIYKGHRLVGDPSKKENWIPVTSTP